MAGLLPLITTAHYTLFTLFFKDPHEHVHGEWGTGRRVLGRQAGEALERGEVYGLWRFK